MSVSVTEPTHRRLIWRLVRGLIRDYAADRTGDAAAVTRIDPEALAEFCDRHRIMPLVAAQLLRSPESLPEPLRRRLIPAREANARKLLLQAAAVRTLSEEAGCPEFILLKGVGCAAALYRRPADRHAGDVDLLCTTPAEAEALGACARTSGYTPLETGHDYAPGMRRAYHYLAKHDNWLDPTGTWALEIHWLAPDRGIFPAFIGQRSHYQTVPTPAGEVAVLRPAPLFVYLCSHGSRSGWARLKFVVDLYLLLPRLDDAAWREIADLCARERLERHVRIALGVLKLHFPDAELRPPDRLSPLPEESRAVRYCLARIDERERESENLPVRVRHHAALGSPALRRYAVAKLFMRLRDYRRYRGPAWLAVVTAPLVRPVSFLWRRTLRRDDAAH